MWLMAIGLTIGVLGFLAYTMRGWHDGRRSDLGSMSPQWLAEYRAGSH